MTAALHAGDLLPDAFQPGRAVADARASHLPPDVVADHIVNDLHDLGFSTVEVPVPIYALLIAAAAVADDDVEEEVERSGHGYHDNRVPPIPGQLCDFAVGSDAGRHHEVTG